MFARLVKQALRCQAALAGLQLRQKRPFARRLQGLDDQLIARLSGKGGDFARGDHLKTHFGLKAQARGLTPPNHRGERGFFILDVEIDMAGAVNRHFAQFTPHPDMRELILQSAFERPRKLGNAPFWQIGAVGTV